MRRWLSPSTESAGAMTLDLPASRSVRETASGPPSLWQQPAWTKASPYAPKGSFSKDIWKFLFVFKRTNMLKP